MIPRRTCGCQDAHPPHTVTESASQTKQINAQVVESSQWTRGFPKPQQPKMSHEKARAHTHTHLWFLFAFDDAAALRVLDVVLRLRKQQLLGRRFQVLLASVLQGEEASSSSRNGNKRKLESRQNKQTNKKQQQQRQQAIVIVTHTDTRYARYT